MWSLLTPIAITFLALFVRGLAPVAAWGGPRSLALLTLLAGAACARAAFVLRREGTASARRDPAVFLLLLHFPILATSYFALGANHGVDAINHLEYIRSMVFDQDLDIRNDDAILGGAVGDTLELDPTQINMHGIGPAFVWAPGYLVAHALCGVIGQACNGSSRPYLAACTLTSVFLGVVGLILTYRLTLRFASRGAAFIGALGIAWGTFLFWYLTGEPTMSHNLSFATAALTFLLLERGPRTTGDWFLVGLSIGYSAMVRFANALLGAAAVPLLIAPQGEPRTIRTSMRHGAALALGAFIGFLPQMYAWYRIFGSPLLVPNGEGFLDHAPAYLDVLFSARGGLFNWSPLLYLCVAGLFAFRRLGWRTAVGFWSVMILLYITNARVPDWWGGSSFGNRRFCTILAPMAVGLAIFADWFAKRLRRQPLIGAAAVVSVASAWNMLIAQGHRVQTWRWNEPVAFPQMARVAVDEVAGSIGSPFSLPGAFIDAIRLGQPIADYDMALFRRPYSTFVLRLGEGDLPFLVSGFTLPRGTGDGLHRSTLVGRIDVVLHQAVDYRIGVRARNIQPQALVFEVNGVRIAGCDLSSEVTECERDVPAGRLLAGRNQVRLLVESGGSPAHEAEILSFWMRPRASPPVS